MGKKGAAEWGLMFPAEFKSQQFKCFCHAINIPDMKACEDYSPTWLLFQHKEQHIVSITITYFYLFIKITDILQLKERLPRTRMKDFAMEENLN